MELATFGISADRVHGFYGQLSGLRLRGLNQILFQIVAVRIGCQRRWVGFVIVNPPRIKLRSAAHDIVDLVSVGSYPLEFLQDLGSRRVIVNGVVYDRLSQLQLERPAYAVMVYVCGAGLPVGACRDRGTSSNQMTLQGLELKPFCAELGRKKRLLVGDVESNGEGRRLAGDCHVLNGIGSRGVIDLLQSLLNDIFIVVITDRIRRLIAQAQRIRAAGQILGQSVCPHLVGRRHTGLDLFDGNLRHHALDLRLEIDD